MITHTQVAARAQLHYRASIELDPALTALAGELSPFTPNVCVWRDRKSQTAGQTAVGRGRACDIS